MAKSSKKSIKPFRRLNNQPVARKNKVTAIKTNDKKDSGKVSKKSKRLQKTVQFVSKLTVNEEARTKLKNAKRKSQTAIVGNMDPLLDALVDISEASITEKKNVKPQKNSKPARECKKKIASEKSRQQSDVNDIALFQKILTHQKFQEDPLFAISDHVKYLMQREELQES